jgi:hypothetical protein
MTLVLPGGDGELRRDQLFGFGGGRCPHRFHFL